jgi:RNA polymerase sigma factor (sigma-70 family)
MRPVRLDRGLVERLHARAHANRWNVPVEAFQSALESSAAHGLPAETPQPAAVERYLAGLHLEDLALACACAAGHEEAWNHFVREFRPVLYRAAGAIDPTGGARDLADALYADLFGLGASGASRQSLFRYFHARSSLSTWLRAVLAQRAVDRARAARRTDGLPDEDALPAPETVERPLAERRTRFLDLVRKVLITAIAALAPRDRLRLASYYAHDLTLAQIGRVVGEHEATVSRHLARTRRAIRETVELRLREAHGLSQAAIDEGFAAIVEDAGPLDLAELLGTEASAPQGAAASAAAPASGSSAAGRKNDAAERSTT